MKILEEIEMFFSGVSNLIYGVVYLGSAFLVIAPLLWLYDDYKLTGEVNHDKLSILLVEIPAIIILILTDRFLKRKREKNRISR